MIVNPSKFQSIIIYQSKTNHNPWMLNIDGKENSVTPLGLEIDSRLHFEKHFSAICNKAAR